MQRSPPSDVYRHSGSVQAPGVVQARQNLPRADMPLRGSASYLADPIQARPDMKPRAQSIASLNVDAFQGELPAPPMRKRSQSSIEDMALNGTSPRGIPVAPVSNVAQGRIQHAVSPGTQHLAGPLEYAPVTYNTSPYRAALEPSPPRPLPRPQGGGGGHAYVPRDRSPSDDNIRAGINARMQYAFPGPPSAMPMHQHRTARHNGSASSHTTASSNGHTRHSMSSTSGDMAGTPVNGAAVHTRSSPPTSVASAPSSHGSTAGLAQSRITPNGNPSGNKSAQSFGMNLPAGY